MKLRRCVFAGLAVAALAASGLAQARDNVYWSLGVNAAPGVSLGVGNVAPVYVAPAPVYYAPQPVYVAPAVTYVRPASVYYAAPVYYGPPGHWRRHGRHHWR